MPSIARDRRHQALAVVLAAALVVSAGCGAREDGAVREPAAPGPPPNVLLISLDACRSDHLSCYGYERPTSPFLDELAAEGVRFANAFVNCHGTPPSHTTMLASLYQETHRVGIAEVAPGEVEQVPLAATMIQEVLAQHGYLTIGVTGGGRMGKACGFDRGFHEFRDRPGRVVAGTRRLLELLDRHRDDPRPVFAFFHTYEIHSPYKPPPRYARMWDTFDSTFEPSSQNLRAIANTARSVLDDEDFEHIRALYDGGIRYTDAALRELYSALADRGFLDDAVVVITADHGEEFGEHGGVLHRNTLYEELLHVPLILWRTGMPGGVVDEGMVSTVDIAPTLLAAAGIEVPPAMHGRDLLQRSPKSPGPELVFAQYGDQVYAARGRRWKLIEYLEPRRTQLFDLDNDPGETRNLAARFPGRAQQLRSALMEWRNGLPTIEAEPVRIEVGAEEREQLEALGYLDAR